MPERYAVAVVNIELTVSEYDRLRTSCPHLSKEFDAICKFTTESRVSATGPQLMVKIDCDEDLAMALLELVNKIHPAVALRIARAIRLSNAQ